MKGQIGASTLFGDMLNSTQSFATSVLKISTFSFILHLYSWLFLGVVFFSVCFSISLQNACMFTHMHKKTHLKQFWVKLTECGLTALSIAVLSKKKQFCYLLHCWRRSLQANFKQADRKYFICSTRRVYLFDL